jgi:ADP-ribose pyrophosphatase YjhB (NUDIX family)
MNWTGSACVCFNQFDQVLMVLQGKPEEEKSWSVPSGGREHCESFEECCVREVLEETGYQIIIKQMIYNKNDIVYYFLAEIIGGNPCIQDPDGLIHEISWKSIEDLKGLQFSFEEDRELLRSMLHQRRMKTD